MPLPKDPFNVIITGVGGQGNVLASEVMGQMLLDRGFVVTIGETLGMSQRGGSVMSHLRISQKMRLSPQIPDGLADLIVGLEPVEALRVFGQYGNPEVVTLINTRPLLPIGVLSGEADYPDLSVIINKLISLSHRVWTVEATEIALSLGNPILANTAILGAADALGFLLFDRDGFKAAISESLSSDRVGVNLEAFDRGREAASAADE